VDHDSGVTLRATIRVGIELCVNLWGEEMRLEKPAIALSGFVPESAHWSMVHPIASGCDDRVSDKIPGYQITVELTMVMEGVRATIEESTVRI
jgi:hypothetical protein